MPDRPLRTGRARAERLALALLVGAFAGCSAPDVPDARSRPLPREALALLQPDSARWKELHPGVLYRYLWSPVGPWAVHLVQADLGARCELELGVLRARPRERGAGGHERVSEMVARSSELVLAAVNADFFTPEGTALGVEIVDGSVLSTAERPTIAWRRGAMPWMGTASLEGQGVRVGWLVDRRRGDGATEAVGGFPDLIDAGTRVGDLEVGRRPAFAAARHPRSAVGLDSRTGTLWLVVVDGRQLPHSAGMTLPELARLLESLGADEALNLDGGGSSVLVLGSGAVNRPSDAEGERPVVNALALLQDPAGCRG